METERKNIRFSQNRKIGKDVVFCILRFSKPLAFKTLQGLIRPLKARPQGPYKALEGLIMPLKGLIRIYKVLEGLIRQGP